MSNFKTQEITEMSKIFHLKLLTEKILEFLNATEVIDVHEIYTIKYLHIYVFSLTFMLFCD